MRIAYTHQHSALLPTGGGAGRPWEFCRRLAADGHQVRLIRGGKAKSRSTYEGVEIVTVKAPYSNRMSLPRRMISFMKFTSGALLYSIGFRPSVVYASSTPLTVAAVALVASLLPRVRVIFEVRDLWPEGPVELGQVKNRALISVAKLIEWLTYCRADAVVALSPYMADGVRRVCPSADVHTIPNGCDLAQFDSADPDRMRLMDAVGVPDGGILISYAGGFGFLYDLEWAIRLAAAVQGDGIYFTFFGDGADSDRLESLARDLGVHRPGLLPGHVPKTTVVDYLKSSDLVLSVLRDAPVLEGSSLNKVFDSMAAGRPAVLNHGGWLTDLIVSKDAGWRLPRDIDSGAAMLRDIVRDREELSRRGDLNRRLGGEFFSRDGQYELLRNLILDQSEATPPDYGV